MTTREERDAKRVHPPRGTTSKTKQGPKDSCDINVIVREFSNGFSNVNHAVPRYADVSNAGDLMASYEAVRVAAEDFLELPSMVRQAAMNDPVRFLQMLETDEGTEVLYDAGLVDRIQPPEVVEVRIAEGGAPAGGAPVAPVTEPS